MPSGAQGPTLGPSRVGGKLVGWPFAPGREGLFSLVMSLPDDLAHEVDSSMVDGDMVMTRGRFTGNAQPAPG